MNLRRHRRARTLALAASTLCALTWVFSVLMDTHLVSGARSLADINPFTNEPYRMRYSAYLSNGSLMASNMQMLVSDPEWLVNSRRAKRPKITWWTTFGFFSITPFHPGAHGPPSNTASVIFIDVPLWIPFALTLPPLLITHAGVRRPLARHRRGLCHRCAYDLASTPPNAPCPECGTARLALPRTRAAMPRAHR